MDAGTELVIERLTSGSIINPHNMLVQRKHAINARFEIKTTFYYLKYQKLLDIAKKHPWLANRLLFEIGKADANKNRDERPLDYIRGTTVFLDHREEELNVRDSRRAFKILSAFKNAIIETILKNRRDKKVKNLRKILNEFIEQAKKRKEFEKMQRREIELLPLDEKLERLISADVQLSELKFENLKQIFNESISEGVGQNFTQMRLLKMNFIDRLMKRGSGSRMEKYGKTPHFRGATIVFPDPD